jgi:hypothetical protein
MNRLLIAFCFSGERGAFSCLLSGVKYELFRRKGKIILGGFFTGGSGTMEHLCVTLLYRRGGMEHLGRRWLAVLLWNTAVRPLFSRQ